MKKSAAKATIDTPIDAPINEAMETPIAASLRSSAVKHPPTDSYIEELERQLTVAKLSSEPVITEVLRDGKDERVTRISHGGNVTIRTDIKTVEKFEKKIMAT